MDISAIAVGGVTQALTSFEKAAKQVGDPASGADTVDLSTSAVALIQSKNDFSANISVLKTADDLTKSTLSLLA